MLILFWRPQVGQAPVIGPLQSPVVGYPSLSNLLPSLLLPASARDVSERLTLAVVGCEVPTERQTTARNPSIMVDVSKKPRLI